MKIAFSGTHGTGKTTDCFKLATNYKKSTNYSVGVCEEVARQCPYEINESGSWISQMWIYSAIVKSELEAQKLYDTVICDRSVVDCVAYTYFIDKELYKYLLDLSAKYITTYGKIYVKTIENNDYQLEDGVRSMDIEFRKNVQDQILEIYDKLDYNVEII